MGKKGLPLEGITILDLTIALSGPLCTQRLGEMGAEVIKIEAPDGGDFSRYNIVGDCRAFGDSTAFVMMNRNKESVAVDLKSAAGREVFYSLVKNADAVVVNFRPGVTRRLAIDYPTLKAFNPRLVYVSITGYGESGPLAARPGQDLLLQSFSGLTFNAGRRNGHPVACPPFIADVIASHSATEAVLAGLFNAARTGRGQEATLSMLGGIMEMQLQEISTFLAHDHPPERVDYPSATVWMPPPYGIHATAEGYLALAQCDLALLGGLLDSGELTALAAEVPGSEHPAEYAEWKDRVYRLLGQLFAGKSASEWDNYLNEHGIWCMKVLNYAQFLAHPQTQPYLTQVDHEVYGSYTTVKPVIDFIGAEPAELTGAPAYAADTCRVLESRGFTRRQLEELLASGAIFQRAASPVHGKAAGGDE
ncbi:CoA transferase [Sodalis sp. dw_96]|uniref:CaiB/BaiF CoA transferase family protein n=1 Tax=Sodalis sp. dw_96 TaxID=2719794 RepID=UPI001BD45A57|nr:CoA transferase [Sodalis sp. dw_96]